MVSEQVRIRTRPLCIVGALLAFAACGTKVAEDSAVAVRDSAGIRIIEHRGNLWATTPKWHLAAEPEFHIGAVDGDAAYLFDGVTGILPLPNGRIVVANSGDGTIRWFDRGGGLLLQRGGVGESPGEFKRLSGLTRVGDTIVAMDWANRRFTAFTSEGAVGATTPITGLTAPPGKAFRLANGQWIIGTSGASTAQLGPDPKPGVHRFDSPILRLSNDGAHVDTLGNFPSTEIELIVDGDNRIFAPARFGRSLVYAVGGDQLAVGTGDALQIDIFNANGERLRSIRALEVDVTLTPEIASAYKEFLRERVAEGTAEAKASTERAIATMVLPKTVPAYSTMLLDDSSNLWLGEYRYDAQPPRAFLVFNNEGRFVTSIHVPEGFRAMAVSEDRVWGRARDEFDVEYVVGYQLQKVR